MSNEKNVKVWDIFVRVFHWSLVGAFFIAYISDEESLWHIYSGYLVLGLITVRVLWGLVGTKYARFSNFIYPPKEVSKYVRGLVEQNPDRYVGHNPAGGWMIIALLLSLFVVTVSGLKVYAIEEDLGPLAGTTSELSIFNKAYADRDEHDDDEHECKENGEYDGKCDHEQEEEFWEEIHEFSTNITLFLIFLHVIGVIVAGKLHNENLVKAMITGKKQPNKAQEP